VLVHTMRMNVYGATIMPTGSCSEQPSHAALTKGGDDQRDRSVGEAPKRPGDVKGVCQAREVAYKQLVPVLSKVSTASGHVTSAQ
jgi:hypothetical protein